MSDITISDQSGGMNDYDAPIAVPEDQCITAENVEFVIGPLGERRLGASAVTLSSDLSSKTDLSWLYRHLPSSDETGAQLWAFAFTLASGSALCYKDTAWHTVAVTDAIDITGLNGYRLAGQTFRNKLFIGAKTTVDRLHVYDGTSWRRVGLAQVSAAPTAADTGGGTFSGTRYYRVRETIQVAGVTKFRSEPSPTLTKAPSGAGTGLIVTKPADMGESATHWELEASLALNGDYYRIATTVVGTATATDSQAYGSGYAILAGSVLSETIGNYTVPISCRFITVDNDRLLFIGSHDQPALGSRVSWTTVSGDITGVGNDERVPIATTNFLDLDTYEGGSFTGASGSINGYVYITKLNHIYRLVRQGQVNKAYEAFTISKTRGALEGSLVEGVDQTGAPCLYFLDPHVGPCIVGSFGLLHCGLDINTTWDRFNLNASSVISRSVFYPDKHQVIWWVAVDGSNTPSLKIILHTNCMKYDQANGLRKGYSLGTGPSATAISACLFASNIESNAARNLTLRPFIGRGGGTAAILQLDNGTTDNGTVYFAKIVTRPFVQAGILNRFGIMAGAVLAKVASGITLYIKLIRDSGVATFTRTADLTAVGSETHIVKPLDDLVMSELHTLQLQYGDDPLGVTTPAGTWEVHQIALKPDSQETS